MMRERTGTTAEGTTWRTRPWSDAVEARYRCDRRGGVVPCLETSDKCKIEWGRTQWFGGDKARPYSPATPKSAPRPLPVSVGDGYLAVFATARLRLDGVEPWPAWPVDKAPVLSKLAKARCDATFTKLYREFRAAVLAAMRPDAAWRISAQ